jgi:hypothetical protein
VSIYSSKKQSDLVTACFLLRWYGLNSKPYGANYPRELLPLLAHRAYLSMIRSSRIFCTVVLLPVRPIHHGTCKHYAVGNVLR